MGLSISLELYRKPTDPEWEKNKRAVVALAEAGVEELPRKLADYFGMKYAEPSEVDEKLRVRSLDVLEWECYQQGNDGPLPKGVDRIRGDCSSGFAIDLDALPKDVRVIKVVGGC